MSDRSCSTVLQPVCRKLWLGPAMSHFRCIHEGETWLGRHSSSHLRKKRFPSRSDRADLVFASLVMGW